MYSRRRNKYGVAPPEQRTLDGVVFASKTEMRYHKHLALMLSIGKIESFKRQVKFQLGPAKIGYIVDWDVVGKGGHRYVVDVKGKMTAHFRDKAKLWAVHGPCPLHLVRDNRGKWETFKIITPNIEAHQ